MRRCGCPYPPSFFPLQLRYFESECCIFGGFSFLQNPLIHKSHRRACGHFHSLVHEPQVFSSRFSIMDFNSASPYPEGVISFLDTDLYKLTMQCAVLKYYKDVPVTYSFTNRTPEKKLSRQAFQWLDEQIKSTVQTSLCLALSCIPGCYTIVVVLANSLISSQSSATSRCQQRSFST